MVHRNIGHFLCRVCAISEGEDQNVAAKFRKFLKRRSGVVHFANNMAGGKRFLDRCTPVFSQSPRCVRDKKMMRQRYDELVHRSILKSARLAEAHRLIPLNPLHAYQMRVEDAVRLKYGCAFDW